MLRAIEDRSYQDDAVALALASIEECGGFALFAEQRTGKTVISCRVVKKVAPERLLIVCPKIAIPVWEAHLAQFDITPGCDVRILTWEGLWTERRKLKRWDADMVIADELHRAKGRHSKQGRSLRILSKKARARLGLTGTPQESGLEDYWAQMFFVDAALFGSRWGDFEDRYCEMGGFRGLKIIGYKNEDEFRRKLATRFFRVLLEEVKSVKTDIAPPHVVRFDLEESASAYVSMRDRFVVELKDSMKQKFKRVLERDPETGHKRFILRKRARVVAPRAITQAMKLHQLTGGFVKDEDGTTHRIGFEKLTQWGALVLALGNVPIVTFVRHLPELHLAACLGRRLGREVTLISGKHHGYISGDPFDLAVVQIRSAISIDLSHAEEAILYSWNYSLLDYDQAKFRIRSYHSTRARYHYLIANGTVDEDLFQVVTNKLDFAKTIIDKYRRL